ncbi:Panacea domain-containing protein [uncultured Draconibacterium sp.]|uniref:Panacea domain-containing protein n=1 Tax=uncultured Draconibacterium sp. TaxID=1573823 RepID=UPI0029C9121A|nr:Panacea domain-containing protein [uncultured Draconibacterium sp.]
MATYSKSEIEKIGNTIIFLAERIPDLSKTKLLKLLYLAEEVYARKSHLPFLGLEFQVWQAGPVARDIFIELSDEPNLLKNHIELNKTNEATYIQNKAKFNDDEFNDSELELLNFIVARFGGKSASELVTITHRKNSNWFRVASEKNLLTLFENGLTNSSDEKIDFTREMNEREKEIFTEQKAFNQLVSYINS